MEDRSEAPTTTTMSHHGLNHLGRSMLMGTFLMMSLVIGRPASIFLISMSIFTDIDG